MHSLFENEHFTVLLHQMQAEMKLATSFKIAKMQAHSTLLECVCAIDPYTESIVLLHAVHYEHTQLY